MRQMNGVYTQRFNRRHGRVGHVFQGRYKSIVIEKDAHLLEVCRYTVLNPVRAGIVTQPRQWRWSNYCATAGLREPPTFLDTQWVLSQFAARRTEAQREYRRFVREGLDAPSPWKRLVGGLVLGGEEFVAQCRAQLNGDLDLSEVPRGQANLACPSLSVLFGDIDPKEKSRRNSAVASAYLEYGYTMKAIADFLGVHYMTVSRALNKYEHTM
jgi:hypothetical protein